MREGLFGDVGSDSPGYSADCAVGHRALPPHADRATWLHKPALLGPLRLLVFAR
jgi:hypothetical protein